MLSRTVQQVRAGPHNIRNLQEHKCGNNGIE